MSARLFLALVAAPAAVAAAPLVADAVQAAPGATLGSLVGGLVGGALGSWRVNGRTLMDAAERAARRVLDVHEARHHQPE